VQFVTKSLYGGFNDVAAVDLKRKSPRKKEEIDAIWPATSSAAAATATTLRIVESSTAIFAS